MSVRRFLLASLALGLLSSTSGLRLARAEEEEPAKEPPAESGAKGKEAPKEAPPEATIAADWKKHIKNKMGIGRTKDRAAYWEQKGTKGKDLFWLGLIWDRGQDYPKSIAALEAAFQAPDLNEKNKEFGRQEIIKIYAKAKEWAKVASSAEAFRNEFSASSVAMASWVHQGRAYRMLGEKDKAVAAFTQAADANELDGILELVDLHLAEGDPAAAKATLAKYAEADIKGKEATFAYWNEFVAAVGTEAPSIEGAKSVGKGDAPTSLKGKPTVLYFWHMQFTNPEARLRNATNLARVHGEQVQVAGISTYNKYNPDTSKKEEGMTEEQELEWYGKFRDIVVKGDMPPAIVVPVATKDAFKLKHEGAKLLVDKDGKFRYIRTFENAPYSWDWFALDLAVKKALGS
jgi:tetratricopeptide (TPR) repeat protein